MKKQNSSMLRWSVAICGVLVLSALWWICRFTKVTENQQNTVSFTEGVESKAGSDFGGVEESRVLVNAKSSLKKSGGEGEKKATCVSAGTSGDAGKKETNPAGAAGGDSGAKTGEPVKKTLREEIANGRTTAEILEGKDMSDPKVREQVVAEMTAMDEKQSAAVRAKAKQLGLEMKQKGEKGQIREIYDFRGDAPIFRTTRNVNAAISNGASLLAPAPYSLNGRGVILGEWDEGSVRNTHQEFGGRVTKKNPTAALSEHSTHVAGTMIAAGVDPLAKGMAPNASVYSYDWNNDTGEMAAIGAATAADFTKIGISNHSYGYNATIDDMGRYESNASAMDALVYSLPYYQPFWAAGNEQNDLVAKEGYQSITFISLGKNVLTVGATEDAVLNGVRDPQSGVITNFSSLGPCDDGRIKPDVCGNGKDVYSTLSTGDTDYVAMSGTSMATPSVAGAAGLLEQLYRQEYSDTRMRNSMLKALLIHTATDIGRPGPDYVYGWGLVNVKEAADLILANKQSAAVPKMNDGVIDAANLTKSYEFTWDGVSPIRATLCWVDPAGAAQTAADSRTPNLVNDLDVKVIAPDGTTEYLPFVMPFVGDWTLAGMKRNATTGKNHVDNVEQVLISQPQQAGIYRVEVSITGRLTRPQQTFSLIVTGGASVETNPPPVVQLTSPVTGSSVLPNTQVTLTATATDMMVGKLPGQVTKVEFYQGDVLLGEDTTEPYSFNWTPPASGVYSLRAKATDQENASAFSAPVQLTVVQGNGVPVIQSFTPPAGRAGMLVTLTGVNFVGVTAVSFNGSDADFTQSDANTLVCQVPVTATTGRITVTNGYGVGSSATDFVVTESAIRISQVYGAGGNTGAEYNQDYIELYNDGDEAVSLAGWSVQYAQASGVSWTVVPLTGTIASKKHFLVGLSISEAGGKSLPAVDAAGVMNMNAASGKVALMSRGTALTVNSPVGAPGLMDFVGYGYANAFEGVGPAPVGDVLVAVHRKLEGAVDTNNNRDDFMVLPPNPRNSSAQPTQVPVIGTYAIGYGEVNNAFSYRVTAANFPTSFGAEGLPAGLTIDALTGMISGVPTTDGTYTVKLLASNLAGTGEQMVQIVIYPMYTGQRLNLLSENMGVPATISGVLSNHVFQNKNLVFSGNVTIRKDADKLSTGYEGASAGGHVFFDLNRAQTFVMANINTKGYEKIQLSFGLWKSTTAASNQLVVEYSVDGLNWRPMSYSRSSGLGTINWEKVTCNEYLPETAQLSLRFTQKSTTAVAFRMDDVVLTGALTGGHIPILSVSGLLNRVNSTYGSPSAAPAMFQVSGQKLSSSGVTIQAPAGYEVSLSEASGYQSTLVVPVVNYTLGVTNVYVRLAAGTTVGTYGGLITCTSGPICSPRYVSVVPSDVRPKMIVIRAQDRVKKYGDTLVLGSLTSGFTVTGMVGSDRVSRVSLTADGGLAAAAPVGTYAIYPSDASGGMYDGSNYDISYEPGVLSVVGASYQDWLATYPSVGNGDMTADPDGDGLTNLMEYFRGYSPTERNAPPEAAKIENGNLVYTYRRSKNVQGLVGVVQWSDDLSGSSWSTVGVTEVVQDMGDYELRTAKIPLTGNAPRKFVREFIQVQP